MDCNVAVAGDLSGGHRGGLRLRQNDALEPLSAFRVAVPPRHDRSCAYHSMDVTDVEDTACEQDELADLVDFEATPEEVLNRIEHCISAFLEELSYGRLQSIQTVGSAPDQTKPIQVGHTGSRAKHAVQVSRESSNAYLASATDGIRLQQAVQTRSLINRQGESAFHFVRIFKVLEVVHELLRCLLCSCKACSLSLHCVAQEN